MKKNILIIQFLIILFTYFSNCKFPEEKEVDELFRDYIGNVPGASIMVIKDGQPIFPKSYGFANLEDKIPVTSQTNFRLASVSKQFTAMCIMMLVEQGKLNYAQTLQNIFPDFPDYGKNITIQNLLQHTSGLISYESLVPDTATIQVLDKDVLKMMMTQDSTYFDPGSNYRYSNSGYAVLAMIIEKISGKSFAQFLKENIFDPLGMINTVAFEKGKSEVNYRAYGYAKENQQFVFKDQSLYSAVLGDGGIYSSVEDLYMWDQALYTNKLVDLKTLEGAFTPGILTTGDTLDYGFGWRIDNYKGFHRVHHTGSTSGFRNVIQRFPDDQFTVIILTNRAEPDMAELAEKLTDLFLIKPVNKNL